MMTDERNFQGLFSELSSQREQIFLLARVRLFLRGVCIGALIWLVCWFVVMVGGSKHFPNLILLTLPAGIGALTIVVHFFIGRDLIKIAPLFRAIAQDSADEDSVLGRVRLTLENDGTFGVLRREGVNLMQWSSDEQRREGERLYSIWLYAGVGNAQLST